jgi:elongation factor P
VVKVIASGVRKGNVIEHEDGKLYIVLKSESMHPGKGTPTTTIDMRRISDGVKTVVRYKTTDAIERAFVETVTHSYLTGWRHVCVHESGKFRADQLTCRHGWRFCGLSAGRHGMPDRAFQWRAHFIELPQRVTLEIVETEPAIKNQTASSSFKPALLSNGVRTLVPPHIVSGTRIVVETADGAYVERAKD